jgi:nucleotide-binding universal stress UspA family protein
MKKILVLTDLSENSLNLTRAAALLANKLHTDVLLFNYYTSIPITPYNGAGPWVGEDEAWWEQESKTKLDQMAIELQHFINFSFPGEKWRPVVFNRSEEGSLAENIKTIMNYEDIEMLVMGSSTESNLEHLIFGNNTKTVINHSKCPVLIIPDGFELKALTKVVFATDFNISDIKAINFLFRLEESFHFQLEVVHVNVFGDKHKDELVAKEIFLSMLEDINHPNLIHKEVAGKDVVKSLQRLCAEQGVDILALLHSQDSLIVRLIRQSTANAVLEKQTIPVFIFPSKMM